MATRTGPIRASTSRGLAPALLILAALVGLTLAVIGLGAGSRQPGVAPVAPTTVPSAVSASPTAAASADARRTFATERWTLSYPADTPSWDVGSSPFDITFGNGDAGVDVSIGALEAAVRPTSVYVTRPDIDPTVDTTVDGYLAWLADHPKLDVTDPADVTVGGRPAKQVDVTLKPGENYAQGSIPSRLGIVWFGGETAAIGPSNGETHRVHLLEVGGETIVVDVWGQEPERASGVVDELLGTLTFDEVP